MQQKLMQAVEYLENAETLKVDLSGYVPENMSGTRFASELNAYLGTTATRYARERKLTKVPFAAQCGNKEVFEMAGEFGYESDGSFRQALARFNDNRLYRGPKWMKDMGMYTARPHAAKAEQYQCKGMLLKYILTGCLIPPDVGGSLGDVYGWEMGDAYKGFITSLFGAWLLFPVLNRHSLNSLTYQQVVEDLILYKTGWQVDARRLEILQDHKASHDTWLPVCKA